MKIFGWMQQKMCLGNAVYHRVAHGNSPDVIFPDEGSIKNSTLAATREKEKDTEALLLHQVLLTIGTFGHTNSAAEYTPQSERQPSPDDDQEDKLKQEEVLNSDVVEPTAVMFPSASTLQISMLPHSAAIEFEPDQKQETVMVAHDEEMAISQEPLLKEGNDQKLEIKRTTLADLLAADQEKVSTTDDKPAPADKHTTSQTTNVQKKIKNAESQPAASPKIRRLITRMLKKKKIHPDLARGEQERRTGRGAALDAAKGPSGGFRLPRRGGG